MRKSLIIFLLSSISFVSCTNQVLNNNDTNNIPVQETPKASVTPSNNSKQITSIFTSLSELSLNIGETKKLEAQIRFNDNSTSNDISWSSSDSSILKIDNSGNIEALKEGRVEITASAKSDFSKNTKIIINIKKNNNDTPSPTPSTTNSISPTPNPSISPTITPSPIPTPSTSLSPSPSPTPLPDMGTNNVYINGYVYDNRGLPVNNAVVTVTLLEGDALWLDGSKSLTTNTINGKYYIIGFTSKTKVEIKVSKENYKEQIQYGILTLNLPYDQNVNRFDFGQSGKINSINSLSLKIN